MNGVKQSLLGATGGLIPGHPVLLLALPALCLIVGVAGISWWVRKTSRALDEKKRQQALDAQKKAN